MLYVVKAHSTCLLVTVRNANVLNLTGLFDVNFIITDLQNLWLGKSDIS